MDPNNQPPQATPSYGPGNYGPLIQQGLTPDGRPLPENQPKGNKSRLLIIIGAVVVVVILLVVGVVIALTSTGKKTTVPVSGGAQNPINQGPQPATAIGITETSNSISQDLSGLNDDKDLPSTMLDDKTLGL